jgi:DNA-binding NarL/FixJ family response regulator
MPLSVLVVDDDAPFRGLARRMLVALGLSVVGEAETVAEAITSAHALRPDAVLVDVGLPDGDGITLAGVLSALPWSPRIILTSTDPDAASAEDVSRSGAQAFIAKEELLWAPLRSVLEPR